MSEVGSKDGTRIAFTQVGTGAPVVMVNGTTSTRADSAPVAVLLAPRFSVFTYDRRGRGDSGDAPAYAVEREVDDLAAVIDAAGGAASVYAMSSGANLALASAASGARITRLALWEPNFLVDDSLAPLPPDYLDRLKALVAAGRRTDAVEYFLTTAVGIPAESIAPLRGSPRWPAMEAIAHTIAYDGAIVRASLTGKPIPSGRWRSVSMPTLVIDGGTTAWLSHGADALARALPNARRRTLAGQSHAVEPDAIAPVLGDFFSGSR